MKVYITIENKEEIDVMVESLKKRSHECASFRLGLAGNVVFFLHELPENGYILLTHTNYNNENHYEIDITDEPSVMKAVVHRASHGEKEIDDNQLYKIFNMLERFKLKK